jgi:hypothetical protein
LLKFSWVLVGACALAVAVGSSDPGHAQTDPAATAMVDHGFANVVVVREAGRAVVAFENARYRDPRRAVREASALLAPHIGADESLVLVPSVRSIPLVAIRFPAGAAAASAASFDLSDLPAGLARQPRAGSSLGRLDVVIHPWFEAVFGDYDNPIASRTGIAPELRVALRRGLAVSAQALVTLQDDVPTRETRVRPGLITVNQTVRLPGSVFVSATAGTFNPNRYGADLEARHVTADGRFTAGAQLGLTGATWYSRDTWVRSRMDAPTALADVGWRVARHDLLLRATAGIFLADQRGVRLDVVRRFGEVELGGFVLQSPQGANGGILLSVPLLPGTYARPGPVRIRPAEAFRWEYRYRGLVPSGRRYRTGNGLHEFVHTWSGIERTFP